MFNLKDLADLQHAHDCKDSALARDKGPEYIVKTKFSDKSDSKFKTAIETFMRLKGHHAERINNTGRWLDDSKIVQNVIGFQKIGSGKYIPSTMQKGTADISATLKTNSGRVVPWRVEIKIKGDRPSQAQLDYAAEVTKAGCHYSVVKDWGDFYGQYTELMEL